MTKNIPVSLFFAEIPPEFVSTVRHGKSKLPRAGQVDWTSQGTTYVSNNLVFMILQRNRYCKLTWNEIDCLVYVVNNNKYKKKST